MTPSGRVQLILGAFATAAVAFLSYFVVKRRLVRGKNDTDLQGDVAREQVEGDTSAADKNVCTAQGCYIKVPQGLQNQESQHAGGGDSNNGDADIRNDKLADELQGQTSFILIDNREEAVPPDNGQHPKKSDRSSDESSYDVIEDDDEHMAETVEGDGAEEGERDEGGHALADSSESKQQDVTNETSMVFIEDLDHSNQSKSGSSFYASADEATEVVSRFDEIKDEEKDKNVELSDVPEDASSIGTAETTFPSADFDFSLLSDKDNVEDDPAWDGSSSHRSQSEAPVASGAPLAVAEESPGSSAVETTESVTSRLDIVLKSGSETSQETPVSEEEQLEASDITEVLTVCQNSPSTVSKENIRVLVSLLRKRIPELHSTVLNCVLRVAAFTQNVKPLRDGGCLEVVADQVQEACRTVSGEGGAELLNSLCQVLTNLTLDPKCQAELEATVPALIDLFLSSDSEPVKLSALRPLINFSSQSSFHSHYLNAVQSLYDLLETGSHIARVQSLKILVNLSLNENMMPHLLAAKAPRNLLELLDMPTPTDLTLRTLTMLANLEVALNKSDELLASIPEEAKTASAETVYKLLHGAERLSFLRGKVLRLTRHNNEDVAHQASKLLQYIQEKSGSVRQ